MRCKNCGWPNKPGEKVCTKCHAPLEADVDDMYTSPANNVAQDQPSLNKTVLEDAVFGAANSYASSGAHAEPQAEATKTCSKCGYPVRAGSEKCPNCKFPVAQSSPEQPQVSENPRRNPVEPQRRPTRMSDDGNKGVFRGTINPYMMNLETEPTFTLKPLKRLNERHDFEEQEYEGKEIVLTRENTEQNNSSITSRQQALVTRVDGRWYIEDRSEQKTTFVQASHKTELHDGDIILLGNRLFEFHE